MHFIKTQMYTGLSRSICITVVRLSMYELYNDERTTDLRVHTGDDTNVYDYFIQLYTHWWWASDTRNT